MILNSSNLRSLVLVNQNFAGVCVCMHICTFVFKVESVESTSEPQSLERQWPSDSLWNNINKCFQSFLYQIFISLYCPETKFLGIISYLYILLNKTQCPSHVSGFSDSEIESVREPTGFRIRLSLLSLGVLCPGEVVGILGKLGNSHSTTFCTSDLLLGCLSWGRSQLSATSSDSPGFAPPFHFHPPPPPPTHVHPLRTGPLTTCDGGRWVWSPRSDRKRERQCP